MNILFFGSPILGSRTFEKLVQAGYSIVGVVAQRPHPLEIHPLLESAKNKSIPTFTPKDKTELVAFFPQFQRLDPDLIIIAAFGIILPPDLVSLPPLGGLNIHFSSLPKYRGPAPVPYAILNGDKSIAATIVKLTERVDDGPIVAQHWEPIRPDDTADSLYDRLVEFSSELLTSILPDYLEGKIPGKSQEGVSSAAPRLTKEDGYIDITNPPVDLLRRIHAFHSWPGVWGWILVKGQKRRLKFLPGNLVQLEGKQPVEFSTFLAGYPDASPQLAQVAALLSFGSSSHSSGTS